MSNLSTQPYKGTRDFYPEDMRIRQWMFGRLRQTLNSFGYSEYDGPMLEPFELYAAKTSEEIVNEQLYWLVDRGERKLAIRPEMTPTLARMVAAKQNELPRPIRWFSIPNLWRYERPQRGRLREHWQLNVDTFGGDALAEDLEICQVIVGIMEGFGAHEGYEVRLNHRALTNHIFRDILQLDDTRLALAGKLLDAAPKMGHDGFKAALEKEGFSAQQTTVLIGLLDGDPKLKAQLEKHEAYRHLGTLLDHLSELGIGNRFRYEPSIMRGFMYYTGMVLEVYDLHPENNRALFGGGRFDNLVGMFGGKPLPGVGFGMGDVTLRNFLETHKLLPDLKAPSGVYIAHLSEGELLASQKLAAELRSKLAGKLSVATALAPEKPKKIFSSAERLAARHVIFVGPDDVQSGRFPMKDLVSGEQAQGNAGELASLLLKSVSNATS
jgi:histidyl-tRNA synthetase